MSDLANIKHQKFIEALAQTGSVKRACAASGIDRGNSYQQRLRHPEFAEAWKAALNEFAESIEQEALRRAVTGTYKPLVYKGQLMYLVEKDQYGRTIYDMVDTGETDAQGGPVLTKLPRHKMDADGQPILASVTEYSDTLLLALLKAKCEGYKDKVELSNAPGEAFLVAPSPIETARSIAFTIALGLRAAEKAKAEGTDLS